MSPLANRPARRTASASRRTRGIGGLAAALACGLATSLALPLVAPKWSGTALASAPAAEAEDPTIAAFRETLAHYGTFQAHARYGEVWVPSQETVPLGWHPYEPCNWIYTKDLGWYYDDRSAWGKIVHHHGRWAHDASLGWVWIAGAEFSPAWVVWRTSETHVGWAPLPPDQDVKTVSADTFNTDKHWIFMDAKTFGRACARGPQVVSATPAVFETTKLVTEIRMVNGIAVFVLPSWLVVNVVDIDINIFNPWTPCFFGAWFWNWNWVQNNIVINVNFPQGPQQCLPPVPVPAHKPPLNKIKSDPPPPPGKPLSPPDLRTPKPDQRADDDTPRKPPHRVGQGPFISPVIVTPRPNFDGFKPRDPKPPRVIVDPVRPDHGRKPPTHAEGGQNTGPNDGPSTGPRRPRFPLKPGLTLKRPSFDPPKLAQPKLEAPRRVTPKLLVAKPTPVRRITPSATATASTTNRRR